MPAIVSSSRPAGSLLGRRGEALTLRVLGRQHHGREVRIQSPKCTIGSAPGCTLRLVAPGVKPLHCWILTGQGGTVVLRSVSVGGLHKEPNTALNGASFVDAPLAPGDRLRVGTIELEVVSCAVGWAMEEPTPVIDNEAARRDKAEVDRLQAALTVTERQATERLAEVTDLVSRLSTERDDIGAQLRTAQQRVAELQDRLGETEGRVTLVSSQLMSREDSAKSRTAELELRLAANGVQRENLEAELDQERQRSRQQQSDWHEERTKLTSACESIQGQLADRQRELDALRTAEAGRQDQSHCDRSETAQLEAELNRVQREAAQRLAEATESVDRVAQQRDALEARLAGVQEELAQGRLQADTAGLDAANRVALAAAEIAELQLRLGDVEGQLAQANSQLATKGDVALHAAELEQTLAAVLAERAAAQAQLELSTKQVDQEREGWRQERQRLEEQRDSQASLLAERERQLAAAERASPAPQPTIMMDQIQQELSGEPAAREQLEAQRQQFAADQARQAEELATARRELETQRTALEAERERQAGDSRARLNELAARQSELERSHSELAARQEELRRQQEEHGSQRYAFDQERISLAEELALAEQESESRREQLERREAELEAARQALVQERTAWETRLAALPAGRDSAQPASETAPSALDNSMATLVGDQCQLAKQCGTEVRADSDEVSSDQAPTATVEKVQPVALHPNVAASPKPVWPKAVPSGQADDESIESYMERLMQRVRGDSPLPADKSVTIQLPASESSAPVEQTAAEANLAAPPAASSEPAKPQEFLPRTAAPEQGVNLAAMRELANTATRSAIESHAQRRDLKRAFVRATGLSVTLVLSLVLAIWAVCNGNWLAAGGAAAGLVVVAAWAIRARRRPVAAAVSEVQSANADADPTTKPAEQA